MVKSGVVLSYSVGDWMDLDLNPGFAAYSFTFQMIDVIMVNAKVLTCAKQLKYIL